MVNIGVGGLTIYGSPKGPAGECRCGVSDGGRPRWARLLLVVGVVVVVLGGWWARIAGNQICQPLRQRGAPKTISWPGVPQNEGPANRRRVRR